MALIKVGPVEAVPPGQVVEARSGERAFAVCNFDGKFYCLDGVCPHAGGPLGEGALQGEMLVCPWHGWEFSCVTGANDSDEDLLVDKYNVVVQNGEIFIDAPES
jgi:nitrite reductase/ring-hydroxylating ferredoxin subunit